MLGVPIAYLRMRQGEGVMFYLFAGWGLYAIGVGVMSALLRGMAPANAFTQHAFQIGSMFEMASWLVLLGQRVEQIRRIGEQNHREHATLRSLALTDALTGLPNRRGLEPAMANAVQQSCPERLAAVFMIDLDGFKPVNDNHGHDVGDLLLIAVAKRLRENVRRTDFVARLGGDEFVIVADGLSDSFAAQQFGQNLMTAFTAPFLLPRGIACHVGVTIGYALAPQDGIDASRLLKRADTAMYDGKQSGKRCLRRGVAQVELATA
jgi:diguanylate cyclase (GGDEF)-like protein